MPRHTHFVICVHTYTHTNTSSNPSGLPACLLPLLRLIRRPFFICRTQRNGSGPMQPCFHPAFSILSPRTPVKRQLHFDKLFQVSIQLLVSLPGQPPAGLAAIPSATSVSCRIQGFTLGSRIDGGTTGPLVLMVERETVGSFLIRGQGTETGVFFFSTGCSSKMRCEWNEM